MEEYVSIKQNREFQRIYSKGKSFVSPALVTYVLKNRKDTLRMGITTSKKTGNAVRRNRSRRVIREAFRSMPREICPGFDLIFVARAKTPMMKSTELSRVMAQHLKSAGVIK
ncbi:Ribonuclease P protein component [Caprobacter fermentans]|uniref:Ribonuclease P protein component n=1 Tax=Caproicibacter fermentans TaxID=2576756 RepID=A0A6N8HYY6_9FIRM|nr:ribonuclease P protein component [Caproicibacter fermentans]MVB10888.1 Ribonuclease P protein component [Caproicibacter fermentans]OCN01591.1 ribonuclease P protein component [Clostridium sp. W14A]QNK39492.1 ribonuclease P protein component [Caproicibacter fermentans]